MTGFSAERTLARARKGFVKVPGRAGGERYFRYVDATGGRTVAYGWSFSSNARAFCSNHYSTCSLYVQVGDSASSTMREVWSQRVNGAGRTYNQASKVARELLPIARAEAERVFAELSSEPQKG